MSCPGVVCADTPTVAFGIANAEFAGAIRGFLQGANDDASGGDSAFVDGIHIFNHNIDAAGFNVAEILW